MRERATKSLRAEGLIGFVELYRYSLLALCLTLPVVVYALARSWVWFAAPFPGFFLMENAVVPTVSGLDWPPDRRSVFHSQVIAVDGHAVRSSGDVYGYVASRPVGTPIEYAFRRDGKVMRQTLSSMRFGAADYLQTCGVMLFFGCAWLGFGLAVGFLQPRTVQARVYLLQAFIAGLYPVTGIFLHQPGFIWLTRVYFVLECTFPATWIHLALVFPVERRVRGGRRFWVILPYAVSGALSLWVLEGFFGDPPDLTPLHLTYLYSGLSFVLFVGGLALAYWENPEERVRARIKAVLPGALLAGTLAFFALTNSAMAGRSFPVQAGLILLPAFSACVAYAIAKYELFDIDRVVRQSFVYALLSIIVISAYAGTLAGSTRLLPGAAGHGRELVDLIFVLLVALALDPLRRAVQRAVDRAFYRTRLDYRATISQLSAVMTTLLDLREVLAQVTRVVTEAMHLESTAVFLVEETVITAWSHDADRALSCRDADPAVAYLVRVFEHTPEAFNAATIAERVSQPGARDQLQTWLVTARVSIVLPLMVRNRPIGLLALGAKRSAQSFSHDDIELLRTLANQTAIAVQNARSYEALQSLTRDLDAKVRQRTEELRASNEELSRAYEELKSAEAQLVQSEKMASLGQLVAGVAHELNNPASFVHGSLANLTDYFTGLTEVIRAYEKPPIADGAAARAVAEVRARAHLDYLLEQTPELLRICAEGTDRIKKIVDDLQVFARTDRAEGVPTDIREGIDSTLRLLGDRINRHGIVVRRDYDDVPRVEVHAGQLNQVWMNLLANALDAVEGRANPEIRVTVHRGGDATDAAASPTILKAQDGGRGTWLDVEIADNGVGIAPRDRQRIFEPFFTTKPIGRGTGLGLSIVYGAVKNHGGTVGVESEVGRGTVVTVRLPVRSLRDRPAAIEALN